MLEDFMNTILTSFNKIWLFGINFFGHRARILKKKIQIKKQNSLNLVRDRLDEPNKISFWAFLIKIC